MRHYIYQSCARKSICRLRLGILESLKLNSISWEAANEEWTSRIKTEYSQKFISYQRLHFAINFLYNFLLLKLLLDANFSGGWNNVILSPGLLNSVQRVDEGQGVRLSFQMRWDFGKNPNWLTICLKMWLIALKLELRERERRHEKPKSSS